MILYKKNYYDDKLNKVAVEVRTDPTKPLDGNARIYMDYFETVHNEIEPSIKSPLKLIAEDNAILNFQNLSEHFKNVIQVMISPKYYQDADNIIYDLAVNIHSPEDVNTIPDNTKTLIIKLSNLEKFEPFMDKLKAQYIIVISEVSSYDEYRCLIKSGYKYFEGNFIETPNELKTDEVPANKASALKLISMLNDPEVEMGQISETITADNILSLKLLNIINSPVFRGVSTVSSIKEAIVRFGMANLKKWVLMLCLCNMSDKPKALMQLSLQRALMCEELAGDIKVDAEIAYTVGLLSTIDAFIDRPKEEILRQTALNHDVINAILNYHGVYGEILSLVTQYQHVETTYEDDRLTLCFLKASKEANKILAAI